MIKKLMYEFTTILLMFGGVTFWLFLILTYGSGQLNNILRMKTTDRVSLIDHMLLMTICTDIINGTLLTQEDDETLQLLLEEMYEDLSTYRQLGVIAGEA